MAPTLAAAPGAKAHRPAVGTRDGEGRRHGFAAVGPATAAARADPPGGPESATAETGRSKARRMPAGFAARPRRVGRVSPRGRHPRAAIPIGRGPWPRGEPIGPALAARPHLGPERLPAYSPRRDPVERFRRESGRRAGDDRPSAPPADPKASVRASPGDFQAVRHEVESVIAGRPIRDTAT